MSHTPLFANDGHPLASFVRRRLRLPVLPGLMPGVATGIAFGPTSGGVAPLTPGVGIVIPAMGLQTVGIPPSGIAPIIGVDRIRDRGRAAATVCGARVASRRPDRPIGSAAAALATPAAGEAR